MTKTKIKMKTKTFIVMCVVAGVAVGCWNKDKATDADVARDEFIDERDGKTYRYVTIGSQVWMAENLNFELDSAWAAENMNFYPDSAFINSWITENLERVVSRDFAWCYDNDESNCDIYGRLYSWFPATTACPAGWRLPSHDDWQTLVDFVGGDSIAGRKLKAQSGWYNDGNGTDEFDFSALPGGYRGWKDDFGNLGFYGDWWTTTDMFTVLQRSPGYWSGSNQSALRRYMYYGNDEVRSGFQAKHLGLSVRCLRSD